MIHKLDPDALFHIERERKGYYFAKRLVDILLSTVLLVLLSPLMLLIILLIYLSSPGNVFFTQERVGARRANCKGCSYWQKTIFRCYKFRTMEINADPSIHRTYVQALIQNDQERMSTIPGSSPAVRKLIYDPRVTRLGKLLRKSSVDELPQLWNVLRGDMSLVGPRPAIPYEVEIYKPWHLRRLEAQQGITGLQQVQARSATDFDEQVRLDIEYIENQSLWLDLKILLKTPLVIISTKGAH